MSEGQGSLDCIRIAELGVKPDADFSHHSSVGSEDAADDAAEGVEVHRGKITDTQIQEGDWDYSPKPSRGIQTAGASNPSPQDAQPPVTSPSLNQLIKEYKQRNNILDYETVHDGVHIFHAEWDAEGVYFYQAFSDEIADYALQHQRFGGPVFNPTRMTWIKPSFAWVLYRSGYGRKDKKQRRILKIKLSHFTVAKLLTWCQCKHAGGGSKGRVQWDPERDLFSGDGAHGRHEPRKMLRLRSIQIGLSRDLSQFYVDSAVSIQDVTELASRVGEAHATRVQKSTSRLELMEALMHSLPVERPYLPRCLDRTLVRLRMVWPDDPAEKAALMKEIESAEEGRRRANARGKQRSSPPPPLPEAAPPPSEEGQRS
jgi:hypothetical protein